MRIVFKRTLKTVCLFLCIVFANTGVCLTKNTPRVVTSIMPFYYLVSAVTEGVSTPVLLLKPGTSPHDYTLKPSDMATLKKADIIFWGGPQLESFLVKPLQTLSTEQQVVDLEKTPQLTLLPQRHDVNWEEDAHEHGTTNHLIDMHFWLDPHNAIALVDTLVKTLVAADADKAHRLLYEKNGIALKAALKKLDTNLQKTLKPIQKTPYLVFHDAYQYFEHRYGLASVGSITLNPEIPPSAKRVQAIHTIIAQKKARCIFKEPQFEPKLVNSLHHDLKIKVGELDPIGTSVENPARGYFNLLQQLADSLKACLLE